MREQSTKDAEQMARDEISETAQLIRDVEIENARYVIRNARRWLDYQRCEGDWKPRSFWQILFEGPRRIVPVPPVPPLLHMISEAETTLRKATELRENCCHTWRLDNASREWRCADCGSVVREEDQQNKCG